MDNVDTMTKHERFVDDYNSGIDRASLCDKYNIAEADFEAFLEFLKRNGFVFIVTESKTIMTQDIDYQKYAGRIFKVIYVVFGSILLFDAIVYKINKANSSITWFGLSLGIILSTAAVQGLSTGEVSYRYGAIKKSDRPIAFYTNIAMSLGFGIYLLIASFVF